MGQKYFWCWSILLAVVLSTSSGSETQDETTPEEYLLQVNQTFSNHGNLEMEARWAYITDISEQNEVSMVSMFRLYRSVRQPLPSAFLKFIYYEKATKFCEISTIDLSYVLQVKSTVEISQNFVTLSVYINFK